MNMTGDTKKVWDEIWKLRSSEENFEKWIKREANSVRFQKIKMFIKNYCRSLSNIKVIELGAGMGVYSLLFARLGADITLLDVNKNVINMTKVRFEKEGILANFIIEDIFNLNTKSLNKFDIVMSFGFIEHFKYPERFDIIRIHHNLLKPGGILVLSVPNLLFFPHEIMKIILCVRRKWHLGYEKSFSRIELGRVAKKLNLKKWKVIGSSFVYDFKKYISLYKTSSLGMKIFGVAQKEGLNNESLEKVGICDDFLGADIVLLGIK